MTRSKRKIVYRFAVILLCMLVVAGCRPRGVLSTRKMRAVVYDLHRADAILSVAGYNYGHDEALAKYYDEVLSRHGVTQAQFDSSLVWYTDHPYIFRTVYPRVIERLKADEEAEQLLMGEESTSVATRKLPPYDTVKRQFRHGLPVRLPQRKQPLTTLPPYAPKSVNH